MHLDFAGKRVLVTGGTRGIGRAIAQAFVDGGARVAVSGRSEASVNAALADFPGGVVGCSGSIANLDGCQGIVDRAIEAFGGLDILVNNAGVLVPGAIDTVTESQWDQVVDTNLKGTFFCTKAAVSTLRESRGNVLNVASVSGLIGGSGAAAYCASKAAVIHLSRALAIELAPEVRVNCLCPGAVDTDMLRAFAQENPLDGMPGYKTIVSPIPQRRVAAAEEIAAAALWLTSDLATFVTGSVHVVDGGESAGSSSLGQAAASITSNSWLL